MNLIINGKTADIEDSCRTVADLLGRPEWEGRLILVELNGEIVGRDIYGDTQLNEGDRIELVHFVGGG
ncbi:thiamine biosynthesis protein ThiS [Paenibacillus sp. PK3_47]|uniref:sulfur carrier protein ThiS n=1 Tax=Paenibacillus sp. PK3_47 TaxID=2072642 RepID=UPI00201D5DA5|nr:sulfur carrier protein ThiS [Paenibacillus sp. PK3_47]UQZ35937.1 thiamine biosynthesis protein ThiS [Paenibacillus sp. PK3_47]